MKRCIIALFLCLAVVCVVKAQTRVVVTEKSGRVVVGDVVERNKDYLRILKYDDQKIRVVYTEDIESIADAGDKYKTGEEVAQALYDAEVKARAEAAAAKAEVKAEAAATKAKVKAEAAAAKAERKEVLYEHYFANSKGFWQYVDISGSLGSEFNSIGANYIGGYRFNSKLFLGLGVGMNLLSSKMLLLSDLNNEKISRILPPSKFNLPVFLHFRADILDRPWTPYASLSVGARVSPFSLVNYDLCIKYNQSGLLGDLVFGVNRVVSKSLSVYLGVGYRMESFLGVAAEKKSFEEKIDLVHGFNLRLGVSF